MTQDADRWNGRNQLDMVLKKGKIFKRENADMRTSPPCCWISLISSIFFAKPLSSSFSCHIGFSARSAISAGSAPRRMFFKSVSRDLNPGRMSLLRNSAKFCVFLAFTRRMNTVSTSRQKTESSASSATSSRILRDIATRLSLTNIARTIPTMALSLTCRGADEE